MQKTLHRSSSDRTVGYIRRDLCVTMPAEISRWVKIKPPPPPRKTSTPRQFASQVHPCLRRSLAGDPGRPAYIVHAATPYLSVMLQSLGFWLDNRLRLIVSPTHATYYLTDGQEGCRDVMLKKGYRLREMWYLCRATASADLGPFECCPDPSTRRSVSHALGRPPGRRGPEIPPPPVLVWSLGRPDV